ncbi:MAG: UDP-N-acetylglucosamine 2-epimerase (non-hydrolyzing) [Symploca sp. SIO2E6]|nr:UDP-N-acetylglucosamine 2-epimerase (non-hydrolyzing) [Symploca sp. SIO2E6]
MKILTVVGARPQFIKAAAVSRAIAQHNQNPSNPIQEILLHTGQHYDKNMSDVFFQEMQIPHPNYHLGIGGGSHGTMTGQMLDKIEQVLQEEKPDITLVYGDTNSTLAGALAAVKLQIPVAHVEAGLRSFNMKMPEEVNRILTDQISQWLFCPTATAVKNLENEGLQHRAHVQLCQVGDVMYDAVLFYQKIAQPTPKTASLMQKVSNRFYLATVHRAENTDNPVRLNSIMSALDEISQTTPVILPLHPRTQKLLETHAFPDIKLVEPVGYFDMITLLSHCQGVFTDSGGLQKEAYFFDQPCITLREETEWIELVEQGFNQLVGAERKRIIEAEKGIVNNYTSSQANQSSQHLYGYGNAAKTIINILLGKSE